MKSVSNYHHVHVDAIGAGPCVLEIFLQSLPQGVGDLVKPNELLDLLHLGVVAGRATVQPLDDGTDITEDACIHQG